MFIFQSSAASHFRQSAITGHNLVLFELVLRNCVTGPSFPDRVNHNTISILKEKESKTEECCEFVIDMSFKSCLTDNAALCIVIRTTLLLYKYQFYELQ